jgi:glycosyltransferase involved in cell wall biosynthesis
MACATPVVGTNRGGVPEVLGAGGVTVDPENTESLATQISGLLSDPAQRKRLGNAGVERARSVFDWRNVAAAWREFLEEISLPRKKAAALP